MTAQLFPLTILIVKQQGPPLKKKNSRGGFVIHRVSDNHFVKTFGSYSGTTCKNPSIIYNDTELSGFHYILSFFSLVTALSRDKTSKEITTVSKR